MADIAALDPVYCDGILPAGLLDLGMNFGVVYFRYVPVRSEDGIIIFERTPCLYLVRPKASAMPWIEPFRQICQRTAPPMTQPFSVPEGMH